MQLVAGFLKVYSAEIILGMAALSLVLLVLTISTSVRMSRLMKRRNAQLESGQVGEIVDYITGQATALTAIERKLYDISCKQDDIQIELESCVQKVGMTRFNAFEDVGGEQSFALALLNSRNTGVVISSLYGRQDCRVYIKSITNGEGERALSEEEKSAVKIALGQ